jgi:chromosome partitioning protein
MSDCLNVIKSDFMIVIPFRHRLKSVLTLLEDCFGVVVRQSDFMTTRIAFVNGKGGVGKTTCSMLISAAWHQAGQLISLDDRDPQKSATNAADIFGISIGLGGNIVVVDTAPTIGLPATSEAIRTADLVVLVSTPSPLDLATTAATAQRIQAERNGPTRLLFNMVQTNNHYFTDMAETAKEIPFPAFKNHLVRRTAYQDAQIYGWRTLRPQYREEVLKVAIEIAELVQSQSQTVRQK